jgi:CheY-like chemotaxis protein
MKQTDRTLRVLIVGGSRDFLAVTQSWLERHPRVAHVRLAHTGAESLEAAAQGDVDLVLVDDVLADMDGFEVTRSIKARSDPPLVALLVLFDYAAVREQARLAGADACLDKTSLAQDLGPAIEAFVAGATRNVLPRPPRSSD